LITLLHAPTINIRDTITKLGPEFGKITFQLNITLCLTVFNFKQNNDGSLYKDIRNTNPYDIDILFHWSNSAEVTIKITSLQIDTKIR